MRPASKAVDRLQGQCGNLPPVSLRNRTYQLKTYDMRPTARLTRSIPGTFRSAAALPPQHYTAYLSSLLSSVAADGRHPSPEWFQSLYASTATSFPSLAPDQLEMLLTCLAKLQLTQSPPGAHHIMRSSELPNASKVPADWIAAFLDASEHAMEELSPPQVVSLLRSCAILDIIPQISWISAALRRLGRDEFRSLDRDDCADVVCLVARLGVLPHESWLDMLALRTFELGLGRMSHTQVARLAWGLAMFQYKPPSEWEEAYLEEAIFHVEYSSEEASAVLWSLAVFQLLPDELWMRTFVTQTSAGSLSSVPLPALVNIFWSIAACEVCKPSLESNQPSETTSPSAQSSRPLPFSSSLDIFGGIAAAMQTRLWENKGVMQSYLPPAAWMADFFVVTEPLLGRLSISESVKVLWSVSVLQLSPPDAWLRQLSQRVSAHLCHSSDTYQPLELLYISRAADDTLTQYCTQGSETVDGGSSSDAKTSSSSNSKNSVRNGVARKNDSADGQRRPPMWLAEVVRDSYMLLRKATPLLPPHWQGLNFRYPPYAQPQNVEAREEGK